MTLLIPVNNARQIFLYANITLMTWQHEKLSLNFLAPPGKRVEVKFIDGFDIESHSHRSEDCKYDYIQFQDGPYQFSQNLTGLLCGKKAYYEPIVSTSRYMRIVFKTDAQTNKPGFRMRYNFINVSGKRLSDYNNEHRVRSGQQTPQHIASSVGLRSWIVLMVQGHGLKRHVNKQAFGHKWSFFEL